MQSLLSLAPFCARPASYAGGGRAVKSGAGTATLPERHL